MRPREVGAEVVVTGGPAADARAEPLGLEGSASLGGRPAVRLEVPAALG